MSVEIELRALELWGHHGVTEAEREAGQRFLFDVWLEAGDAAVASDRIEDAVDYRDAVAIVQSVAGGRRYALLEALAGAVADALVGRLAVTRARVRVRKPEVVLAAGVAWSAVSVERRRPAGGE